MADRQFNVGGVQSCPADWLLPSSLQIIPKTAYASYNGTSASGSFKPCLRVRSDSGHVAYEAVSDTIVAAGGSADVTWFPWWRGVTQVPGPSPNPLGTLWAWWDFSDTSSLTIDGSGKIMAATDKTGNGHDVSQTVAANRPSQTTVNALNAALCDTTLFTFLQGGPWAPALAVPYSAFAVWTSTRALFTNYFPGATGTIDPAGGGIEFQHNDTGHIFVQTNGGSIVEPVVRAPFTQTLTSAIVNGASSSLRVNGTATAGSMSPSSLPNATLGTAHNPNDAPFFAGLTGAVCEVLYYEGALSAAQLSAVESYLRSKWATP